MSAAQLMRIESASTALLRESSGSGEEVPVAARRMLRAFVAALARVVAAPYVLSGQGVSVQPHVFGFNLHGSPDGRQAWATSIVVSLDGDGREVGRLVGDLARPVLAALPRSGHLGRGAATHYVADGLDEYVRFFASAATRPGAAERGEQLLSATGLAPAGAVKRASLPLPDGRRHLATLQRTCCAGARHVDADDLCPTCPRIRSEEERARLSLVWARNLPPDVIDALSRT